ncbi:uracil-xanthine permease family protein [Corynebacterium sputi]|uniref:uracil-xanthine permease family protein n=1 Tax=Corynebacterium sputi TaxID=489915 RepID=UPI000A072F4F|nr:nucleobase:cation symporter-2 family protein [Corynebacterium sputi]
MSSTTDREEIPSEPAAPAMEGTAASAYGLNDMPPPQKAIPLALQHLLAMFVGNAAPPLILATAIGMATGEVTLMVQLAMVISGVTTMMQTFGLGPLPIGARLPVMQGTSFAFLAVALLIAQEFGIAAVFGGAVIAGAFQVLFGFSLRWIAPLFPPLVCGIIILVIGVSLMPTAIGYSAGGAPAEAIGDYGSLHHYAIAALVVAVIVGCTVFAKGFVSVAAVLIGLIVGYIVAAVSGMVTLDALREAAWFQVPQPLAFGMEFYTGAVLVIVALALASSVESIGDLTAVARTGLGRSPTPKELSRGIVADGVGTSLGAMFSAMPNTTFSQNTGIVALTGVVSRFVVGIAGAMLLVAGLIPKFAAAFNTIPYAVLGGATLVMFSMVAATGLRILSTEEMNRRNMLILAVSLGLGIGFSMSPPEVFQQMPQDLALLLTSGIVPAMFASMILNLILPKERSAKHVELREDGPTGEDIEEAEQVVETSRPIASVSPSSSG